MFIPDLRRPATSAKARALTKQYSGDEPEVFRRDFYNSLLVAFTPAEVRTHSKTAGLEELRVEIASDRHLVMFGTIK